jgi:hypothetical protein
MKNPQYRRRACSGKQRLSQTTLLAMVAGTPSFQFFANMDPSTWEIFSFNPQTRTACVLITNSSGERVVSIDLQQVTSNNERVFTNQNL